ncbi:MAG: cytochrome c [Deltaproteobacteria bacterium]|nr:cytochrome c [Deltaproteobacteria bacterium]
MAGKKLVYKYYPVQISHKTHTNLGIECAFCHREASSSAKTDDYLMPAGHGFSNNKADAPSLDKNPCRVCHIYSSDFGIKDNSIPAKCKTCHLNYSDKKPPQSRWVWMNTNLRSNHNTHYEMGIPCIRCHIGFDMIEETTLRFIPKKQVCMACHANEEKIKIETQKIDVNPFAKAKLLFRENCSMCHGTDGKGDGLTAQFFQAGLKPRDLTDTLHMSKRTDKELTDVILKGGQEIGISERMPAWEGLLKEDEIGLLVKYIRSISAVYN